MRIELLQLPEKSDQPPHSSDGTWRRFFDFASVTNNPRCFYDALAEGRFASLGAWDEAKAALLISLGRKLLPGRASEQDLEMVAMGRQSDNALSALGLAIHSGTTRSIQRALVVALDRARKYTSSRYPTLLTTDFEYPGIVTAIDEIWDGPVFVARLKSLLHNDSGKVPGLFARAARLVRPDVIYISHVDRYTGFVFPWEVLTEIAGKADQPPIVVIDGAQAAGNIDLSACLRLSTNEGPHLYATSAHKFLGALPTLGLLIALRRNVADNANDWNLEDKAVAYSLGQGARGTGSIESMASLARSLHHVLTDSYSTRDAFLNGLADGPWTVVQHGQEYRSGLFQISTKDPRVALRLERLRQRKSGRVGYQISSSSGEERFLDRGIRRRDERVFLTLHDDNWRVGDDWKNDVNEMAKSSPGSESYRVSIHPRLHSNDDVAQLCAFLNDPRSWRDREFTVFEQRLLQRLDSEEGLWRKLIALNVRLLQDDRFPSGPWGASYHATCDQLIAREAGESDRDRQWGEGGVANTYYALRGLRSYVSNVVSLETALADHWSDRIRTDSGYVGVYSPRRSLLHDRVRHACFAYLTCVESAENLEDSPLALVKRGQEKAILAWIKRVTERPEEELPLEKDDWPFGGLCVLHRVLRDLGPDSRAEDLVMEQLAKQLVLAADGLRSHAATPSQLSPIFLSSVHAFSTLVDGRILQGRKGINEAIKKVCGRVMSLTTPHPRFTVSGPVSMSAALAALSFFMWPWLEDVWDDRKVPEDLLTAVDELVRWIEANSDDPSVYSHDYWSEFHGSFLALDVVQARRMHLGEIGEKAVAARSDLLATIRAHCERGRPGGVGEYDPLNHPLIFAPV